MAARKLIDKVGHKLLNGRCFFCGETNYASLNNHRILPGEDGGVYTPFNTLVVCANCHQGKIHADPPRIVIDRKYQSTGGWVLHYWEDGEERWQALEYG